MAPAFLAIALSGCAHSSQSEKLPNAEEVLSLQYDYQSMLLQHDCLGRDSDAVRRETKLKFDGRMEAIKEWSERVLGHEALDDAMQSQWPDGFIFVTGCRIEMKNGKAVVPRPRFEQKLEAFEKRIPDLRD